VVKSLEVKPLKLLGGIEIVLMCILYVYTVCVYYICILYVYTVRACVGFINETHIAITRNEQR
jgi:hypothetical protein